MFFADLHIHSKFSRTTRKDPDIEHMALWARKNGVIVLGTGDRVPHIFALETGLVSKKATSQSHGEAEGKGSLSPHRDGRLGHRIFLQR